VLAAALAVWLTVSAVGSARALADDVADYAMSRAP
jgi:hypothetical protein